MKMVKKKTPLKKTQAGGRSISQKAAERKSSKGKGTISYRYGDKDAPGTEDNKGSYVGFSKESKKSTSPFVSMKDAKPARKIKQKGGTSPKKSPKPTAPINPPRINMVTPEKNPRKKPNNLMPVAPKKPLLAREGGVAKKSLRKAQTGLSTGTPFQQYMKTPGAVASDTVMQTLYPNSNWDAPKKPVAKNPKNQGTLEKAYEKTYGQNWRNESGQPHSDETFEQYKRRMGPMKKGGTTKAQKGKTVKPKAMYGKSVKPGMMKKGGTKKK